VAKNDQNYSLKFFLVVRYEKATLLCPGITKYAADSLGDVVYAALPDPGTDLEANSECGALGKTCMNIYGIT
jgi:glycine cleavage system H lipoate-binding protein